MFVCLCSLEICGLTPYIIYLTKSQPIMDPLCALKEVLLVHLHNTIGQGLSFVKDVVILLLFNMVSIATNVIDHIYHDDVTN